MGKETERKVRTSERGTQAARGRFQKGNGIERSRSTTETQAES